MSTINRLIVLLKLEITIMWTTWCKINRYRWDRLIIESSDSNKMSINNNNINNNNNNINNNKIRNNQDHQWNCYNL